MDPTKKLLEDILNDRIKVDQLDVQQLEAVLGAMREGVEEILQSADTEDEETYAEDLLSMVDFIDTVFHKKVEESTGEIWDEAIDASVARGNTYFELENYVLQ